MLGSANLTSGGLKNNYEASILLDSIKNPNKTNEIVELVNEYLNEESFKKITSFLEIESYKIRYIKYHKILSKAKKEIENEIKKTPIFEITPLLNFIKKNKPKLSEKINEKNYIYTEIEEHLIFILKSKIKSDIDFSKEFDKILSSFYSSGLHRNKNEYYPKFKSVIQILSYIKNDVDTNVSKHYKYLTNEIKDLNGFSLNVLTEILNTFYPNSYPVMNTRVLKVLNSLGLTNKTSTSQIKLIDYKNYIKIISEVGIKSKLGNFRAVDLAISEYYNRNVK